MAFIDKDDIKTELGMAIAETKWDTLLASLATSVLSMWDELTNMVWASAERTEYYSVDRSEGEVYLKNYPVTAIASMYDDPVWEYGANTLVAAADYTYDAETGIVYYIGKFNRGRNNIKVTYTAGYADADVPGWLKAILQRQAAYWFTQAKNNSWGVVSKGQSSGGGSISYTQLRGNLLPDFIEFTERYV